MGESTDNGELDLMERATILSEATGRDIADVLADLADDGVLNDSHRGVEKTDLISELQDAAALIQAVQEINRAAGDNTVLNGNGNQTEMKVDTTLEGDIVDRAIESVQRKAENIKKLMLILAPVFLLIGGGSLDAIGLIDLFGDDAPPNDGHEEYNGYGGCTIYDAQNYDSMATFDDGSCWWDNTNGGDGEHLECHSDWGWHESYSIIDNDFIRVYPVFRDSQNCGTNSNGDFVITLNKDGEYYGEKTTNDDFIDQWNNDYGWGELPEGMYDIEVEVFMKGSNWHWNLDEKHWVEDEDEDCIVDLKPESSSASLSMNGGSDIEVNIQITNADFDCPVEVEILLSIYYENSYQSTIETNELDSYWVYESANITISHERLNELGDGNWSFETRFIPIDGTEYCCQQTNTVWVGEPEPEPEPQPEPECNGTASFFNASIGIETNNTDNKTSLTVWWDADWSCNEMKPIEIDIYIKENGSIIQSRMIAYNITSNDFDLKYYTFAQSEDLFEIGHTYEICMVIWVQDDGWSQNDEYNETFTVS